MDPHRRRVLQGAALGILAGLAGCSGDGGDPPGTTYVPTEPDYKGWFDGVSNYTRTVEKRGQDEVTIEVGVQGDSGYYKYGPAAVAVSPGTTVTWEWTGKGGTHNVVARGGALDSGQLVDEAGYTFEQTLETPGVFYYLCEPHETLGMKGAMFVALGSPE